VQCMGYLRMMWSLAQGRMILLRMTKDRMTLRQT
jgi:hypothetical protein